MREQTHFQRKIERKKQVRTQMITLIVTFVIILILALTFGGIFTKANTPSDQSKITYKYFSSIMIQYGDSLDSISEGYLSAGYHSKETYLNEIIKINTISSDVIHYGEYLILPYYSYDFK